MFNDKKTILLLIIFISFWRYSLEAQTSIKKNFDWRDGSSEKQFTNKWSFGLGVNIVDDSGNTFGAIKDPSRYLNYHMPLSVNVEYYLNNSFSLNANISINKYTSGKQINNGFIIEDSEVNLFSSDFSTKYYFRNLFQFFFFDPYVFLGFGYLKTGAYKTQYIYSSEKNISDFPENISFLFNTGIGFNLWLTGKYGANFNATGKWNAYGTEYSTNFKQYSVSIFYLL